MPSYELTELCVHKSHAQHVGVRLKSRMVCVGFSHAQARSLLTRHACTDIPDVITGDRPRLVGEDLATEIEVGTTCVDSQGPGHTIS